MQNIPPHTSDNLPVNDYYPAWLSRKLLEDSFPWEQAQSASMPAFLAQYSLHDSPWIGFWFGAGGAAIAALRWDTIWFQERVPFPGSNVAEWPIILIRFAQVYQYLVSSRPGLEEFTVGEEIATAESRPVEPQQRQALLAASLLLHDFSDDYRAQFLEETLHHTIFYGTYRQHVHILHRGEVQFFCFDPTGARITIPGLAEKPG